MAVSRLMTLSIGQPTENLQRYARVTVQDDSPRI